MSMNKDVLRPDETGLYTHVVDRWIHESHTDMWDAVVKLPYTGHHCPVFLYSLSVIRWKKV
jgi:hypothetical protein